jgi:hypothetical protein
VEELDPFWALEEPEDELEDTVELEAGCDEAERPETEVVSSVDRVVGIGNVVIDPKEELDEALSGPTSVPLWVVEIEPSVDGQPSVPEEEDSVASGFASEEDGGSVTVIRREIVVVIKVVVVEVDGRPLLVKYTEVYVVDSGVTEEVKVGEALALEELVSFHPALLMPGNAERVPVLPGVVYDKVYVTVFVLVDVDVSVVSGPAKEYVVDV